MISGTHTRIVLCPDNTTLPHGTVLQATPRRYHQGGHDMIMIYNRPVSTRRLLVWELLELSTQRHHDSEGLQSLLKRKASQQSRLMFRLARIRTLHSRSRRFLLHCARTRRLLSQSRHNRLAA